MSLVVLLILAIVWAVFLVPQVLRARADARPADSIGAFRRQLSVLERTTPAAYAAVHRMRAQPVLPYGPAAVTLRPPGIPRADRPTRAEIRKRRRDILFGLLAAMGGSLVLGLLPALRVMWTIHLLLDVVFVAYVVLLVRARNLAAERELKVRFLPASSTPEPAMLLRRSAN